MVTRNQSNSTKAVPNDPTHYTCLQIQLHSRQTDRQTPCTLVAIACGSCIRCSLLNKWVRGSKILRCKYECILLVFPNSWRQVWTQGSAATYLRCREKFWSKFYSFFPAVKKLTKVWQRYFQQNVGSCFVFCVCREVSQRPLGAVHEPPPLLRQTADVVSHSANRLWHVNCSYCSPHTRRYGICDTWLMQLSLIRLRWGMQVAPKVY